MSSLCGWGTFAYGRWFFDWSEAPGSYAEGMVFLFAHMCFAGLGLVCLATAALDFDRRRFGRWDAGLLGLALSHPLYLGCTIVPAMLGA